MEVDTEESGAAGALRSADLVILKLRSYEIASDLSVIVCKKCQVAVSPKNLLTHVKVDGIKLTKQQITDLKDHIPTLKLASESSDIPPRSPHLGPIDHIKQVSGYECGSCGYCSPQISTMNYHWSTEHKDIGGAAVKEVSVCQVQAFFLQRPKYFPIVPILKGLAPNDKYRLYLKQFSSEVAASDKIFPGAKSDLETPPLLRVTLWHEHLAKFTIDKVKVRIIRSLVDTHAAGKTHPWLGRPLSKTIQDYMRNIREKIKKTDIPTLMLLMNYPR